MGGIAKKSAMSGVEGGLLFLVKNVFPINCPFGKGKLSWHRTGW